MEALTIQILEADLQAFEQEVASLPTNPKRDPNTKAIAISFDRDWRAFWPTSTGYNPDDNGRHYLGQTRLINIISEHCRSHRSGASEAGGRFFIGADSVWRKGHDRCPIEIIKLALPRPSRVLLPENVPADQLIDFCVAPPQIQRHIDNDDEVIASSSKYHRPSCHIAEKIYRRNYKTLSSWKAAVALSLDPCQLCRPHFQPEFTPDPKPVLESPRAFDYLDSQPVICSSSKYHRPSCHIIERIYRRNYETLSSWEAAIARSLEPCQVCRPYYAAPKGIPAPDDSRIIQALHAARTQEQEWQQLADERDAAARAAEEENNRLRAQNATLAHNCEILRQTKGKADIPIPQDYQQMPEWIDTYFSGRLFLHPKADRALKHACFENVPLVYRSLQLLADTYWPLKVNSEPARRQELHKNWEAGYKQLQLEYNSQSISPSRLGEFRDQYMIDYRIGLESRQTLGPHLKSGNTKDHRYCMRIYFIWDSDKNLIVIGHLPSHLDTRTT